jgi:hypothetical protein
MEWFLIVLVGACVLFVVLAAVRVFGQPPQNRRFAAITLRPLAASKTDSRSETVVDRNYRPGDRAGRANSAVRLVARFEAFPCNVERLDMGTELSEDLYAK